MMSITLNSPQTPRIKNTKKRGIRVRFIHARLYHVRNKTQHIIKARFACYVLPFPVCIYHFILYSPCFFSTVLFDNAYLHTHERTRAIHSFFLLPSIRTYLLVGSIVDLLWPMMSIIALPTHRFVI
jgi:hypothetical protein